MIPDKVRRKKQTLGVLKRMLALRARRDGRMLGGPAMDTDIDHKVLWRMRMADQYQGNAALPEERLERPEHQEKRPWLFYLPQ
jgi:hypothetical protein